MFLLYIISCFVNTSNNKFILEDEMKLFKRFLILFILFLSYTFICAFSYASSVSSDISDNVFRLHIIANSDSEEDQNLKLIVRDNIINYMKEISSDISTKEEAIDIISSHLTEFHYIATQTIKEAGYDYSVNLSIGKFDFPTKEYGDISLPSGIYDALRIEIGEANGHNWWCVMFPTLCFVDVSSGKLDDNSKGILESNLSDEEFSLVSEDTFAVNLKFKIVEFFEDIKISLANR